MSELITSVEQPTIEPLFIECKFTLDSRKGNGGDFERNTGGSTSEKRITFEGYATKELYYAVMDAVSNISNE